MSPTAASKRPIGDVAWAVLDAPIGPLTVAATSKGVLRIDFGGPEHALPKLDGQVSGAIEEDPERLAEPLRQLEEYFAGERRRFTVKLDRSLSHGFRLDVLRELSTVPFGSAVSYGELAERVGHPRAARAVGTAMATNPISIVVPCHRVLHAGGGVGGYGGGLVTKRWLLRHEGVPVA